jgi:hypothetical protein
MCPHSRPARVAKTSIADLGERDARYIEGGGAKKQRREPSGRLQRQNSPSGDGCASLNGTA